MRACLLFLALFLPGLAAAQDHAALARAAYDRHVMPRLGTFATTADALAATARDHCAPGDETLRAAYQTAFDGWMGAQHLRFGPLELDDRAYALAFWPDTRGRTPAGLKALIAKADPAAVTPEGMAAQSIAVRGFFALDYLLYDPAAGADGPYGCAMIQAISGDIARVADEVLAAWAGDYGQLFLSAGAPGNTLFLAPKETTLALFTALQAGLAFDRDQRLGRPMGSFAAPTPLRAEARRSGRPQRNLVVSLQSLSELALILAEAVSPEAGAKVGATTTRAVSLAEGLKDPLFEGVSTPSGRLRLEQDQQAITAISSALTQTIGPALGVAQGFNAQDGDGG